MAYSNSRKYDLNTFITNPVKNGKFDEDEHKKLVRPLHSRIKDGHDGIAACYISQVDIEVTYWPEIITAEQVRAIVEEAVEWAAEHGEGLFPLRGDKTPGLFKKAPEPPADPNVVIIKFGTHVVAYPPSKTEHGNVDMEEYLARTHGLTTRIADVDGVSSIKMYIDSVRIVVDTKINTVENIRDHALAVLKSCKPAKPAPVEIEPEADPKFWRSLIDFVAGMFRTTPAPVIAVEIEPEADPNADLAYVFPYIDSSDELQLAVTLKAS